MVSGLSQGLHFTELQLGFDFEYGILNIELIYALQNHQHPEPKNQEPPLP